MNDLVKMTARQAVSELKRGAVSPLEIIDAALDRIDETGDAVNALPTICADRAREHAARLPDLDEPDTPRGYLHGLPIAIKDLKDVAGVRSTRGSPIFADHVPDKSDLLVTNLEDKGGIVLAKANTPEFGAGANTFNEVFGKTRNPWDTSKTCGGSSGGSTTALASGQVWLASGSDFGGSLRIPASFCSVVGLRPTPGRVAHGPSAVPFATLSVEGPMGRNVGDVALMLDAQAGAYTADPLSLPAPSRSFLDWVDNPTPPTRVAYSPDLGITPVDSEVAQICRSAIDRFADIGAEVEETSPDFTDAEWIFQTLRGAQFVASYDSLLREHRSELKEEVIWNIEHGLALSPQEIARAGTRTRHDNQPLRRLLPRLRRARMPYRRRAPLRRGHPLPRRDGRPHLPHLHKLAHTHLRSHTHRLPHHLRPLRLHQVRPPRRHPDNGPLERRRLPPRHIRPL